MNPLLEIRSPWPARTGAICSGMIVVALSFAIFFIVLPPVL